VKYDSDRLMRHGGGNFEVSTTVGGWFTKNAGRTNTWGPLIQLQDLIEEAISCGEGIIKY